MLDIALSLVDRLITLTKQKHETDRKLHDDFLKPLVEDFDQLHKNYIETFMGYRQTLNQAAGPLNPSHALITRIETDSRFTAHLRTKLLALSQLRTDPIFGKVVWVAHSYICSGDNVKDVLVNGWRSIPNAPRAEVVAGLKEIFSRDTTDAEKRLDGLRLIDRVIDELQDSYQLFFRLTADVKARLLDKRVKKAKWT